MKATLISIAIRLLMGAIALGVGIWYLSSSISGTAITYTSMDGFLGAIGVENGDIATANGCFLCGYISELFAVIGRAAEMFWTAMVDNIWILMAIGFGLFLIIHTAKTIFDAAKTTATLDEKEKKLELKGWFDKVWRQGARVMIVGALMGALGMGGTAALKTVANITITPVLFVGAELSMAATGITDAATCGALAATDETDDILNPVLQPFMCVMGNINSVMLAGAAGGFSLMNYAWMGLGGGVFTWIAGLALVLMFLVIGFDLVFQILSVVFKLVFLIIFLPLILAAAAFEQTWTLADGVVKNAINMLVRTAIQVVGITLKVLITYAIVAYAADAYFPGPRDGYSAILPPMMGQTVENPDAQTLSVMNVFSTCERVATTDGEMDGDKFKDCFTAQKAAVEREYPHAFDFMDDGWDFLVLMFGIFLLYFYAIKPKVDGIITGGGTEEFDFGAWAKGLGKKIWAAPQQIFDAVSKAVGKK